MKGNLIVIMLIFFLSGCNTTPIIDLVNTAKCVTEVATKDSKFTCEFEGKKVLAKK
ncbi:hypothetical protein [Cellvibrio sp. QJXJ]|uniref:hypothetical protein n=1 Tax=Cellvibrio sp. QJXJ TaxID=2964606 RepID=UPI0021C4C1F6|nr:hypothetical protein [Cellvibrio sp. QJXJ]UUA73076.1 hypothetical protein NNX04_01185 [Cellvibrio sp. QJXJ]